MRHTMLLTTCLAGFAISSIAHAQAVPQSHSPAVTSAAGIQDIVVTAQRRSENLQHAALAISAVSGAALQAAGVTKPTELTALVPSLQVAPSSGPYSLFYLRGVGNFSGNALSDSAVAFNFDGVYIGRPSSTTGFFYDLERVEVLKGPQGTLYGRNATGGAINVISHKPDLNTSSVEGNLSYGNYNAIQADGAVNLPISRIAALRVSGTYVKHDGYMLDGTDDQNDLGGRASLRVDPADNLKIIVTGDYFRQRGEGVGAVLSNMDKDKRQGLLSPAGDIAYSEQPNTVLGRPFAPIDYTPFQHNNYWGASSTIEWKVPVGTITIIPAHREGNLSFGTVAPGFILQQREKDRQTSLEARLTSSDDHKLRYLFGVFYYDETNVVPDFRIFQESLANLQFYRANTKSMATFGRLTYAITPQFRLNVGARYTTEDKTFAGQLASATRVCIRPTAYFPTYMPGCPTAEPIPFGASLPAPNFIPADGTLTIPGLIDLTGANARHASFDKVTYRFGGDWDITQRNLVYASYETGFKSGGFFFSSNGGVFKPESIKAITIGSKNRFFDNKVQLNVELFHWRYSNQQISHLSQDSAGDVIFTTENVGRATFKGAEVETQFLPTPNTLLNADVQYLDAKYNSFVYTTPNLNSGAGNGTACPNGGTPSTVYTVNCSGNRPPNAPKWTVNIGAQQTIPLANDGKIVLAVRGHYQTKTLVGLEFTAPEYQSGYWLLDGQLTYSAPKSRYSIGVFANNVLNETVYASSFPVPSGFLNANALRPPRTFGVRGGFKF